MQKTNLTALLTTLILILTLTACNLPAGAQAAAPTAMPSLPASETPRGHITFAVNVHDWVHSDESAATLLRLIDIFERYGVRGDFYFTAPVAREYVENYPQVITRLKESGMTISYHVRAPHPLTQGFDAPLKGLQGEALRQAIRDYETYRLEMDSGDLDRSQAGGYTYVAGVFGANPVVASPAGGEPGVAALARQVYAAMGARTTIKYHEEGTKMEQPFEYIGELLVRPSDFSVTRVTVIDGGENFWWNFMTRPDAKQYAPLNLLQIQLNEWEAQNPPRPPFITALIHENNFYRRGSAAWGSYYYEIDARGNKGAPLSPPFDLSAPDPSTPRSPEEQEAIWQAYEELVAWAAANLLVITSADLVELAATWPGP